MRSERSGERSRRWRGRRDVKVDSGLGAELSKVVDRVTKRRGGRARLPVGGWRRRTTPSCRLTLAAEHSSSVSLGTGVAIAFARNPMSLAYTTNQLQEYSGGRVVLGVGVAGATAHREAFQHDVVASRGADARVRARFAGDLGAWNDGGGVATSPFEGEFYTHTLMTPVFAPAPHAFGPPSVFLAAVGPRMNEVAGEVADGVITHGICTARYLREVILPASSAAWPGRDGRGTKWR